MSRKSSSQTSDQDLTLPIDAYAQLPAAMPLLPIRDAVHFPNMVFPLFVGREKSILALDEAVGDHHYVILVTQRSVSIDDPEPPDLYTVGIAAEILQILKVPDGTVRVMLQGVQRIRILNYTQVEPFFVARAEPLLTSSTFGLKTEALMRSVTAQFEQIVAMSKSVPPEAIVTLLGISEPDRVADHIAWHLPTLRLEVKQDLLESLQSQTRLERLSTLLSREAEIRQVQKDIHERVEKEMGETQRDFFLREQLKAIQLELGERDDQIIEVEEYRKRILAASMPSPIAKKAMKEINRLERMPSGAPEGVVTRTYLDTLADLPWNTRTEDNLDIDLAESILDEDHCGLSKVKERIIEFLAVRKLAGTLRGPILCFTGPPGVGKTSLGRSIARAMNRKFHRISLGGIRDEAEIRGHRRTYIGALPGRIIQAMKQVGVRNPVIVLDEIDKLVSDFRGDPASALLEALDPEQNHEFSDHYIEAPFDLSEVMFITTANILDTIPNALRDRMEIIHFTSYTEEEKINIARSFLVPKLLDDNGVAERGLIITDDALSLIVREYTREAGVRNLEREIGTICRKIARKLAGKGVVTLSIDCSTVSALLGPPRYRFGLAEVSDQIGTATGLVYTEAGGDIVTIEVVLIPSKTPKVTLTGQLGDVMKESAQAALTYVRSKADVLAFDSHIIETREVHVHVPAGATPKDGPSAGITIATAIASALTGRPVRREVAMTGEITLRGRVLPVGGFKEKVLAAHRAGLSKIIYPRDNETDLAEIPDPIRNALLFIPVTTADEVLDAALCSDI